MPSIDEVRYSEDATVLAVRDYYAFLEKMYLDGSQIIDPPEHHRSSVEVEQSVQNLSISESLFADSLPNRWPSIGNLRRLGKDDIVLSLLARLPYIAPRKSNVQYDSEVAPSSAMADWNVIATKLKSREDMDSSSPRLRTYDPTYILEATEPIDYDDFPDEAEGARMNPKVSSSVVGLTFQRSPNDEYQFLLDTKRGIVVWTGCPMSEPFDNKWGAPSRDPISDHPDEYAPDEELDWRCDGISATFAVDDFFEVLKEQFRTLKFVPLGPNKVVQHTNVGSGPEWEGLMEGVQRLYREYGWPHPEHYRKADCLAAIKEFITKRSLSLAREYYSDL